MMNCPTCRDASLQSLQLKDTYTEIDRCTLCGGLWFDRKELEDIMDVAAKDLIVPSDAVKTDLACPRDGNTLYAYTYPQTSVTVDMCRECAGLWLDDGELQEIKRIRSERAKLTTEPEGPFERFFEWIGDLMSFELR